MLSRKSKDKSSEGGLAGKYIKKDSVNPEMKSKRSTKISIQIFLFFPHWHSNPYTFQWWAVGRPIRRIPSQRIASWRRSTISQLRAVAWTFSASPMSRTSRKANFHRRITPSRWWTWIRWCWALCSWMRHCLSRPLNVVFRPRVSPRPHRSSAIIIRTVMATMWTSTRSIRFCCKRRVKMTTITCTTAPTTSMRRRTLIATRQRITSKSWWIQQILRSTRILRFCDLSHQFIAILIAKYRTVRRRSHRSTQSRRIFTQIFRRSIRRRVQAMRICSSRIKY